MVLLDTTILVHAYDAHDQRKHAIAKELLRQAVQKDQGVISSQVVQEFCSVILHKFAVTIKPQDLKVILDEILLPIWQHLPTMDFYKRTLRLLDGHSLNFYDALIVQAAIDLGCDTLYSEDLQDGQLFGTVKIVNPFKA